MQYKQMLDFVKRNNPNRDYSIMENDMNSHCTGKKYDEYNAKYGYSEKKVKNKIIPQYKIIETDNNHCSFYKANFNIVAESENYSYINSSIMRDILRNCK
jgi:hypothetical protein